MALSIKESWLSRFVSCYRIVAITAFANIGCLSFFVPHEVAAQDAGMKKITEIEGISEFALDNGVQVLLFPDPSKEVVTVNMTIFVGSRHEGYGEAGMAHLLEHMLFKGTPDHQEVPKALTSRGADFNGTTWLDRTNYYETLPASDDNLKFALELESDRLVNSFIKGEDLESEMTVVRNEFERGENSSTGILMQRIHSAAFDWHNYGQSTIGNRSDIERVPVVNLRRFYRKYYRPDNVMLIVAGKFDTKTAQKYIQDTFGKLKSPETPIDPTYTVEPPQDGERTIVLRRVGDVQLVGTAYHIPAGSHPDYAAMRALVNIMSDQPSGRLYRGLVETEIATNAFSSANGSREPSMFMTIAEVPKDNSLEQCRQALVEIIEKQLVEEPITEQEVERAKQRILKFREMAAANSDRIAISLSDWAAQGDWRLYFLYRDNIENLTAEKVQAAAEKYLVRNNRTVGLFIPSEKAERIEIPEAPDLVALLDGYKGREVVQEGEQFDPAPLAIEKRTERGDLVDGIRYALLPKKTRGGAVNVTLTLRYGTEESLKGKVGPIELMGILMGRGTADLDYQQIRDELTRLRANVSFNTTVGLMTASISTKREFLPEVIALVNDMLRKPRMEDSELEVIRRQIVTSLEQSVSDPQALAIKALRRQLSAFPKGHPLYVQTIEEEIAMYKAVTADQIRAAYKQFLSSQAGELTAVGDFDPATIKEGFTTMLKGWDTDEKYVRIDRPANTDIQGESTAIETPDKANAVVFMGQQYTMSDEDPVYASLVLGNFILGGGSLSSRLADRVRQKEGLSYGVGSNLGARPKDSRVDFMVYAITNPGNKDKVLKVIREEFDRLRKDGVTEEELAKAKVAYLQSARVGRTNDRALTGTLLGTIFNDRTMKFRAEYEERINAATVDSVNSAIRGYITPENLIGVAAGDFANNKEAAAKE